MDIPHLNYEPVIAKVTKIVNKWKKRYLTPLGKITVIKTFILGGLNHILCSIPYSKSWIDQLTRIMFSFLWDDKPHKVSKRQITNDYFKGGLKMTHLNHFITAQKLVWIKRLFTCGEAPWAKLLSSILDKHKLFTIALVQKNVRKCLQSFLEGSIACMEPFSKKYVFWRVQHTCHPIVVQSPNFKRALILS